MTKKLTALAAVLTLLDQLIKHWAKAALPAGSRLIIPGLLRFTYVENYGAAFGILQQQRALLLIVTGTVLAAGLWVLWADKLMDTKLNALVAVILAGGIGNFIDRAVQGYVVDYLDVTPLFNFPVFNFADCCVVVGTMLAFVYILFFDESGRGAEEQGDTQD